jgi:hypothetical protein
MLAVLPAAALYPLRDAARSATEQATGSAVTGAAWTPHVTLCYSTEQQSAAPLIAALGLDPWRIGECTPRRCTPCHKRSAQQSRHV